MNTSDQSVESMIVRESGDELLILDLKSNLIHQLNCTASLVWRLCGEGWKPDAIVAEITHQFAVDEQRARQDVLDTVNLLCLKGLLRDAEGVSYERMDTEINLPS